MDFDLQIGKYTVRRMLGRGATGTVYLAVDTFSGQEVALKTIEPEVFRDPEFGAIHRAQFQNEASLAGKLKHPHIVAILDAVVGEDAGHIAMEYVPGGDLSAHTVSGKLLAAEDVIQVGFKCCWALDYAYREGIVHRDIKPANLMMADGYGVKIADFGAALLRKTKSAQTATIGSPFYMSPEQIDGADLTFHSDMYCLATVLYELLTGQKPFVSPNQQMLLNKIRHQQPTPPSTLRSGLAPEIDRAILRAMAKDPDDRFASWAEFAQELARIAALRATPQDIPESEQFLALKSVPMLNALSDAETWELVKAGRWARYPAGEILIREGATGRSFYFLAQGRGKVTRKGRMLNVIEQGECVGEMSHIRGGDFQRQATFSTMTASTLAEFSPETLQRMSVGAQLQFTRALASNLVDRLAAANKRIA